MASVGFRLNPKVTAVFFDRPAVVRALTKAEAFVFRTFGFRVRQEARKLLKVRPYIQARGRRKGLRNSSRRGQPPIAHETEGIRRIYYSYDAAKHEVIIGPVQFRASVDGYTVPELHEHGGSVTVPKRDPGIDGTAIAKYQPRPFMAPALQKRLRDVPELWKDAITKHA